jgi:hypothetical protein
MQTPGPPGTVRFTGWVNGIEREVSMLVVTPRGHS